MILFQVTNYRLYSCSTAKTLTDDPPLIGAIAFLRTPWPQDFGVAYILVAPVTSVTYCNLWTSLR
ncbi:hypothetical protein SAMN05660653_02132, partial [Desulfonatronum thiosulfatophilum]